ncbi:hypothetical protein DCC79_00470 [bacterium]|nr:hypothetical protein [Chloroflexi bacterium CFX6]RIL12736.1 MAG: hypothetical protein DCC79_00470 [bacterium]
MDAAAKQAGSELLPSVTVSRIARPAAVLLLVVAFALRVGRLEAESFWRDEIDSAWYAQQSLNWALANFGRPGWNGALYHLGLQAWAAYVGFSPFTLRFSSVIAGMLLVALITALGRVWFGRRAGLIAGGTAAVSPYLVWYSQELKMYAWLACLAAASILALDYAMRRDDVRFWIAFTASVVATTLIHVMGFLMFPVWIGMIVSCRGRGVVARRLFAIVVLASVSMAFASFWPVRLFLEGTGIPLSHDRFSQLVMSTIVFFGLNGAATTGITGVALIVFLLVASVVIRPPPATVARQSSLLCTHRSTLLAWISLLGPIVGFGIVGWRVPLFADRYVMVATPAFVLCLALGLTSLRRFGRGPFLTSTALLLLVMGTETSVDLVGVTKMDYRGAAAILNSSGSPGSTLIMISGHSQRAMRFYGVTALREIPWPYPAVVTDSEVERILQDSGALTSRVWLLESDLIWADPTRRVKAWLDARCSEPQRAFHLRQLDLYDYRCPIPIRRPRELAVQPTRQAADP